ncbi:MAG: glucokinase [Gemmatimonadota bacterium]
MGRAVILAADVGGTKSYLSLYELTDSGLDPLVERRYRSTDFAGVPELLEFFVRDAGHRPSRVVLGVPGPVRHPPVKPVNLPWVIDPVEIGEALGLDQVYLLNDLEATAYGTLNLQPHDVVQINAGVPDDTGNRAVIAAGTGLGEGGLCWAGDRYVAIPSEGGHASFAPGTDLEAELWKWLFTRYGHVSWERVVSGPGLEHIYEFLRDAGHGAEPDWLAQELAGTDDRAGCISRAAASGRSDLAEQAVDLFVSLYGAEAGNLALKLLSSGGVYIGGGIAPKMIERLRSGAFMDAFAEKGRVSEVLRDMPVYVVLNDKAGLLGAAYFGAHLAGR